MTTEKQTPEALAAECKRLANDLQARSRDSSLKTAIYKIHETIDRLAALASAQAQQEPVAPEHGQLDPRTAYATGKRMKAYCESFNGQQWGGVDESVDRSNLAAALENLEEVSAMLMNMAERVPLGPVIYAGALIDTAPATAEQPQAREITDAEIDDLMGSALWSPAARSNVHRVVRAAIALANGRAKT